eukprot:TRINITY_DN291_c0_g1_i2.p1 TRINITY_DN291_c0_g1~~TRINITY_DN291_c0_g1_i2.p1  ORF type:complete len:564 (-),score=137.68 TRINITY_DN291_c0_g1_i2:51-1712(-)
MAVNLQGECQQALNTFAKHLRNSVLVVDQVIGEILQWNVGLQLLFDWGVCNVLSFEQEIQKPSELHSLQGEPSQVVFLLSQDPAVVAEDIENLMAVWPVADSIIFSTARPAENAVYIPLHYVCFIPGVMLMAGCRDAFPIDPRLLTGAEATPELSFLAMQLAGTAAALHVRDVFSVGASANLIGKSVRARLDAWRAQEESAMGDDDDQMRDQGIPASLILVDRTLDLVAPLISENLIDRLYCAGQRPAGHQDITYPLNWLPDLDVDPSDDPLLHCGYAFASHLDKSLLAQLVAKKTVKEALHHMLRKGLIETAQREKLTLPTPPTSVTVGSLKPFVEVLCKHSASLPRTEREVSVGCALISTLQSVPQHVDTISKAARDLAAVIDDAEMVLEQLRQLVTGESGETMDVCDVMMLTFTAYSWLGGVPFEMRHAEEALIDAMTHSLLTRSRARPAVGILDAELLTDVAEMIVDGAGDARVAKDVKDAVTNVFKIARAMGRTRDAMTELKSLRSADGSLPYEMLLPKMLRSVLRKAEAEVRHVSVRCLFSFGCMER